MFVIGFTIGLFAVINIMFWKKFLATKKDD